MPTLLALDRVLTRPLNQPLGRYQLLGRGNATGSRVGGALYVLKGNSYVRISIGGAVAQEAKIKKTKALAAKAIARL